MSSAVGAHCRARGSRTLVADVPSAKFAARWTDRSAPRKPPALLLGRLYRDECTGWLFDRQLLYRERRPMHGGLCAGAAGKAGETRGQSCIGAAYARTAQYPWTTDEIGRHG